MILNPKKLSIIIPCMNEERGVGKVLSSIPYELLEKLNFQTETIVIDNNSTDDTVKVARKHNVTVIKERNKGKGNAIVAGFKAVSDDSDYVVMLDGDNTYKSREILRMIEPLMSGFCEVVVGTRLGGKTKTNSLKLTNRIVNWGFTFLVRQFYGANITDVLSGYYAWKKEVIVKLMPHLEANGFEVEMDMVTKMKKLGFEMYSVPITYDQREGESKIQSISDGLRILFTFFINLSWKPGRKNRKNPSINPTLGFDNSL